MDSAGFLSLEEIQWIWGKILANEFEKPGSTPPNMIATEIAFTEQRRRKFGEKFGEVRKKFGDTLLNETQGDYADPL